MASCLSGGGRAYGLKIDVIKSPSSTSWISNSPSPSSSLSESSNSQIAISTRKPRTPRKRPNETYNEAAALLSKIYPKLFPMKHLTEPYKFTKQMYPFTYESSELLLPFQSTENSSFLIHPSLLENPQFPALERSSCEIPCLSPGEITSTGISMEVCGEFDEDFDAESILDEEIIEQGIQSILGNSSVENESSSEVVGSTCYGYPVGLGYRIDFENGFGSRNYIKAFRNYDDGEWLGYNSVNIEDITPKFHETPTATVEVAVEAVATGDKKKKKKRVEKMKKVIINKFQEQKEAAAQVEEPPNPKRKIGLFLKLDYDNVLKAWSDQESPFSDDSPAVGNDVHGRISAINMLTESGGIREARVLRYKEKRRTRLFSKKIRYQVRKLNADQRPRMQGRFVRRSNSPESGQG